MQILPINNIGANYKLKTGMKVQKQTETSIPDSFVKTASPNFKGFASENWKLQEEAIWEFMAPYFKGTIEYTKESAKKFVDFLYDNAVQFSEGSRGIFKLRDFKLAHNLDVDKIPTSGKPFFVHLLTKLSS